MQNFLYNCCWSKSRASNLNPISLDDQQLELNRLYKILYTPRVSFESVQPRTLMNSLQSGVINRAIKTLTIDLPGAEPSNVYLEIAMVGDPVDTLAMRERIKSGEGRFSDGEPMQDIADCWIHFSRCEWIPHAQGQGLRMTGAFNVVPDLFGSQPNTVYLRLRYRTPLISMLGAPSFIGGEQGVAFTLNSSTGVMTLRDESTPELDTARRYALGGSQCSIYLQPGVER